MKTVTLKLSSAYWNLCNSSTVKSQIRWAKHTPANVNILLFFFCSYLVGAFLNVIVVMVTLCVNVSI